MFRSLTKDPVMPVLAFKHYDALENRLHKLMKYILECIEKLPPNQIVQMFQPEYHNLNILETLTNSNNYNSNNALKPVGYNDDLHAKLLPNNLSELKNLNLTKK